MFLFWLWRFTSFFSGKYKRMAGTNMEFEKRDAVKNDFTPVIADNPINIMIIKVMIRTKLNKILVLIDPHNYCNITISTKNRNN